MKLQLGSRQRHPGWYAFDAVAGPEVDFVGDIRRLSAIADNSVEELYASHVLEHIPYADVLATLTEWHRVLIPGGRLMVAVPDMNILAQFFVRPDITGNDKVLIMQMMFGGQHAEVDFHYVGFDLELLGVHLYKAGFESIRRVASFGLFDDSSEIKFRGTNISLNVEARKRRS